MTILAARARRESIYIYVLHLILHMELMAACSLASRDLLSLSLYSAAAPCFFVGFSPQQGARSHGYNPHRDGAQHSREEGRRKKERKKEKKGQKRILYSSLVSLVSRSLSHSAPSLYDDK